MAIKAVDTCRSMWVDQLDTVAATIVYTRLNQQSVACKLTVVNYDQQGKLRTRPTPLPLLINTQHYSLFKIAVCLLWRQTPLIKDVFHPASYTVDHSLSGVHAQTILRLRTRGLRNLEIVHMRYAISRLHTHMQSRHCLRNLGIPRMHNAISRLHKFPDCAGHIYSSLALFVALPQLSSLAV